MPTIPFAISPSSGSVFRNSSGAYDEASNPFQLTFEFHNRATTWVDIVVDIIYPTDKARRLFNSGQMDPGSDEKRESVPDLADCTLHITRWAPGIFGIPGNGGGELVFNVPQSGNGIAHLTVNDPGS